MLINPYRFGGGAPPGGGFGLASRSFTSGDYIDMGDILDTDVWVGTTSWSIAMWVKPSSIAAEPIIFSKLDSAGNQRQFYVRVLSTGAISGIVYNITGLSGYRSAKSTATTVADSTWHHVVFKCDQSLTDQLDIWDFSIDGTQSNATTWLASTGTFDGMGDKGSNVQASGVNNNTVAPFLGNMADIRIYDKILSDAEVTNLHAGTDVSSGLVGWWITNVDDGVTTLPDYSTNSNDATNNGTTYSTDGPLD